MTGLKLRLASVSKAAKQSLRIDAQLYVERTGHQRRHVHKQLTGPPFTTTLGIIRMGPQKFRRENLRYVFECEGDEYYWIYHFGKSFYVNWPWEGRAHHSIQTVEALTCWIERNYFTRVIRVIPEKDLKRESSKLKEKAHTERIARTTAIPPDVSATRTFMAHLPRHIARVVGGTSVLTFKAPGSDIRWGTKRRKRR